MPTGKKIEKDETVISFEGLGYQILLATVGIGIGTAIILWAIGKFL